MVIIERLVRRRAARARARMRRRPYTQARRTWRASGLRILDDMGTRFKLKHLGSRARCCSNGSAAIAARTLRRGSLNGGGVAIEVPTTIVGTAADVPNRIGPSPLLVFRTRTAGGFEDASRTRAARYDAKGTDSRN